MSIKLLSDITINRIKAGEVIERPSSVVKELVENSLDAGATEISIKIQEGGRNLIIVSDNGVGMSKEDLALAVQRHATSKLNEEDIHDINFFGFRGEAIPSIAAVSKMTIASKRDKDEIANEIIINGGEIEDIRPANLTQGTKITIRDLFYTTPARLKFLRTITTEQKAITDIVKRLSLANPNVSICFEANERKILDYKANLDSNQRMEEILGKEFIANSSEINYQIENISITGRASIPTYNRTRNDEQFFFVNKRALKDKNLYNAVKIAYSDYLVKDKYASIVLNIEISPRYVDVNVHPSKTEVRFRDYNNVRSAVITAIKKAIISDSHKTSSLIANQAISAFQKNMQIKSEHKEGRVVSDQAMKETKSDFMQPSYFETKTNFEFSKPIANFDDAFSFEDKNIGNIAKFDNHDFEEVITDEKHRGIAQELGVAACQLHETYIVAQAKDGIVIIDQHAVHERIIYEELKEKIARTGIPTQRILIPEIIEFEVDEIEILMESKEELSKCGIIFDQCSYNAIILKELPCVIANESGVDLIKSLVAKLLQYGENVHLQEKYEHIFETIACHNSIRAGKKLSLDEMNVLIKKMAATDFSGQCNHGRPTFVKLKLTDIEKLFGRV